MTKVNVTLHTVQTKHVVTAQMVLTGDVQVMLNLAGVPFSPDAVRVTLSTGPDGAQEGQVHVSGPMRRRVEGKDYGASYTVRKALNFAQVEDAPMWLLDALRDSLVALNDQMKGLTGELSCESCGTTQGVTRMFDPYDLEVNDRETDTDLCDPCAQALADEA